MKYLLSALVLATLSVVACGGDDDDDTNGDNGGSSTSGGEPSTSGGEPSTSGGSGGSGTSDGGEPSSSAGSDGGGGAPSMNVMCDPEADGVCQNPMDCPYVVSGEARLAAGECGQSCLLGGDQDPECPVDCMLMEKELDMSSECATCYGDAALCGIMECAAQCLDDPEAEQCVTCLVESGCREAFNDCSGLEQ